MANAEESLRVEIVNFYHNVGYETPFTEEISSDISSEFIAENGIQVQLQIELCI